MKISNWKKIGKMINYCIISDYDIFPLIDSVPRQKQDNPNVLHTQKDSSITSDTIEKNTLKNGYMKMLYDFSKPEITPLFDDFEKLILKKAAECLHNTVTEQLYIETSWVVIQESNDYTIMHHHGENLLSGVYYVQIPKEINPNSFPDGVLNLIEQNHSHFLPPIQGLMAFWPAYYLHCVYPFVSNQQRIAISYNIRKE